MLWIIFHALLQETTKVKNRYADVN